MPLASAGYFIDASTNSNTGVRLSVVRELSCCSRFTSVCCARSRPINHAKFSLSDSEDRNKKKRIVRMNRWTPSREWEKDPTQKSKPIRLEAGR